MGFYDAIRVGASGAADSAYTVDRSLRFNDGDSAKLNRTFGTNSSNTTKTLSFWIKRGNLGSYQTIFGTTSSGYIESRLQFTNTDELQFVDRDSSSGVTDVNKVTTRKFRDVGAWYHIVFALNSTDGTAEDRVKIYVNGVRETSFSTSTNPSSSYSFSFYRSSVDNFIGANNASDFFDGYLTEINFSDGQALDQSSFGETNSDTGQWNPKKYVGSYGTNGFYLNFSDNSGTTATTLGKDSSGNGNNFTPNNFSVSAGLGNDSFEDTPTNNFPTLNPNHAFLNGSSSTAENGNLQWNGQSNNQAGCPATMAFPKTGKWYWEVKLLTTNSQNFSFGITPATYSNTTNPVNPTGAIGYAAYGSKGVSGVETQNWAATFNHNDNIGAALDMDNNEIKFYKNNSLVGTISLVSGYEDIEYLAWIKGDTATQLIQSAINFGGNGFVYTPPTGYKKLSSANLPDPTIKLPNKHFASFIYTGTGSSGDVVNITNSDVDFTPDWVWVKTRTVTNDHILSDSVRGGSKYLVSSETYAEQTDTDKIRAFIQNGFESGTDGDTNWPSRSFVAWNWNAGDTDGKTYTVTVVSDSGNKFRFDGFGTSAVTLDLAEGGTYIFNYPSGHPFRFSTTADGTHGGGSEYTTGVTHNSSTQVTIVVAASAPTLYYYCSSHSGMGGQINTNSTLGSSNFDGSTQSVVKVNQTAGFSIVLYTGQQNNSDTIGHGLGVKPQVVISKSRNSTYTYTQWYVHHHKLTTNYFLFLNTTAAQANGVGDYFIDGSFSSTVFAVGDDIYGPNVSNNNYVAYCFSEVAGYSKFGSYTGNGSSDGTFVFTGFRPAFILAKSTYNAEDWYIYDNKREGFNVTQKLIYANLSLAEGSGSNNKIDFLSNGFKFRSTGAPHYGTNSDGYIYLAFAESPFKNARAR